jgi:quinol monooxygenase YgiN
MAHQGKTHLTYVIIAPPDQEDEGRRIFKSHGRWMESTHHRTGEKALLSYEVSIAPELTNPMDQSSAATGNTCFVLTEIYESEAGVADHFQQAQSTWEEFPALVEWLARCRMFGVPAARITNSLW